MYFDQNIKLLRTKKGYSQQDLADSLNLTRSKLNSYERGVQPPFDIQIDIADYFNVTLDGLVRHDLSKLTHFKLSQILKGSEADVRGRKLRLLTVSVDANEDENIDYTTLFDQLNYYYQHPINLNRKEIKFDLEQLMILNFLEMKLMICRNINNQFLILLIYLDK